MTKDAKCDDDEDHLPCTEPSGCVDCLYEEACERERAMTRPVFDRSFEDITREDEWSGPHGFLFDPMTYPTKPELSRQFLDAADQLVEAILSKNVADYTVAYPALFLYRHAIELVLKSALGGDLKGHRLADLADEFARRCKDQHGQAVPAWIISRLKEIAEVDPNSTAFRYAENFDPKLKKDVTIDADFHVDLRHLQRCMTVLHEALSGVIGKISRL
jgi:hypothetical protein